jgi:eukaryotic-like serine/threonine-protein kinase
MKKAGVVLRVIGIAGLLASAALIILLALDMFVMPVWTRLGSETVMPDLRGLDYNLAEARLSKNGFVAVLDRNKIDPTGSFKSGQIMEQFPAAGGKTKSGRRVYLTVCAGGRHIKLADYRGTTFRQCLSLLGDLGLNVDSSRVSFSFDSTFGKGVVLAQQPLAGDSLLRGESLGFDICLGPRPQRISVPSLLGLSEYSAEWLLRESGLQLGDKKLLLEKDRPPGIRSQEPKSGNLVDISSEVNVWINITGQDD